MSAVTPGFSGVWPLVSSSSSCGRPRRWSPPDPGPLGKNRGFTKSWRWYSPGAPACERGRGTWESGVNQTGDGSLETVSTSCWWERPGTCLPLPLKFALQCVPFPPRPTSVKCVPTASVWCLGACGDRALSLRASAKSGLRIQRPEAGAGEGVAPWASRRFPEDEVLPRGHRVRTNFQVNLRVLNLLSEGSI